MYIVRKNRREPLPIKRMSCVAKKYKCVTNSRSFANKKNVFYCKKKSKSVSNLGTFANLKLEVQFQFSGKFPASCHQQQTGKVIISSQECLAINNIKRIRQHVNNYIFLSLLCKHFFYVLHFFHCSYKWFECHSYEGFLCKRVLLHLHTFSIGCRPL